MIPKFNMNDVFVTPVNGLVKAIRDNQVRDAFDDGVSPYDAAEQAINQHSALVAFLMFCNDDNTTIIDIKNYARDLLLEVKGE